MLNWIDQAIGVGQIDERSQGTVYPCANVVELLIEVNVLILRFRPTQSVKLPLAPVLAIAVRTCHVLIGVRLMWKGIATVFESVMIFVYLKSIPVHIRINSCSL